MDLMHQREPFDLALSLGDNQYIDGNDVFAKIFEIPYAPLIAEQLIFYQTVGNHDMEKGRLPIQLQYSRSVGAQPGVQGGFALPAENYVVNHANLKLIVINVAQANGSVQKTQKTLDFLRKALCADDESWKVVSFHYPLWSTGPRGDNMDLQEAYLPILEECRPDFAFAGHEHHAEYFKPWNWMQFAIVGNAADLRSKREKSKNESLLYLQELGFASLNLKEDQAVLRFLNEQAVQRFEVVVQKRVRLWADAWKVEKNRIYGRISKGFDGEDLPDQQQIEAQYGLSTVANNPLIDESTWKFYPAKYSELDEGSGHLIFSADLASSNKIQWAVFRYRLPGGAWIYGDAGNLPKHGNYDGIRQEDLLKVPAVSRSFNP
jgi:hypothetical protein